MFTRLSFVYGSTPSPPPPPKKRILSLHALIGLCAFRDDRLCQEKGLGMHKVDENNIDKHRKVHLCCNLLDIHKRDSLYDKTLSQTGFLSQIGNEL